MVYMEELYSGKESVMEETKRSFHKDFRLAKLSYRLPPRNTDAVDAQAKEKMISRLCELKYDSVILFSGFWAEFISELIHACPRYRGRVQAVHMDAVLSLSWKNRERSGILEHWLFHLENNQVCCSLSPFQTGREAPSRILVHGGGWGLGSYDEKITALNQLGYPLDIIVYYPNEVRSDDSFNQYYLLDPEWKPDEGKNEFPRLLKYQSGSWIEFGDRKTANPLSLLLDHALAILSKPDGGTLCDSLACGVPILFTEPLAPYEQANRDLWIQQGFGMKYTDFITCETQSQLIQHMRQNILDAVQGLPVITEKLIEQTDKENS